MKILEGVRVLDFTQYLAGPTVTRLMAEMGAEIIKVETAPGGDPSRLLPMIRDGRSGYFVQQNRGKQSLCLDLRRPEAQDIVRALVGKVDVVVENFGPGVMEKRGLAYQDLAPLNPRLVMASISAYGRESPLSHKTGYDWVAQAFAGIMFMTGPADGPPMPAGLGIADVSSGVHAFSAIGYALFHRERTGQGQWLDIAMIDSMFHAHEIPLQAHSVTHGAFEPMRAGNRHPLVAPFGVFKGPTGYLVILALQLQWKGLCEAMARPDLEHDPRFVDGTQRAQHQRELDPIIEGWLATFPDNDSVLELLERHRVPSAPVLSPIEAIDHPYFKARGTVRRIEDRILGPMHIPGFPLRFSAQPELPDLVAPLLGEHNTQVLAQVLGYDAARIANLHAAGVLVRGER
ncbi:MAG: CoA transferase [Gammaproteobacteria bacterium]|nr:CoA transferase [Gammaproteobacteria bacterium]